MANFLRKIVKDIHSVKNIMDIPSMKKYREEIRFEITKLTQQLDIVSKMLCNKNAMENVVKSVELLNDIKGDKSLDEMCNNLTSYLKCKLENMQKEYDEMTKELAELNKELENINNSLDKARGKV